MNVYDGRMAIIDQILVGEVEPFGPGDRESAIRKRPTAGRVRIERLGVTGDAHGDREHHGGVDAAVHHYAFDNYALWRAELPEQAGHFKSPGFFGENLTSIGITEADVCIGDTYRLGSVTLQLSQGRQPCWKLARRSGFPGFSRLVQETGRTGWFYRVIEAGSAEGGDELRLLDRPHPDWPLARLLALMYRTPLDRSALERMAVLPELSPGWREIASKRLETGKVEEWTRRLTIPSE